MSGYHRYCSQCGYGFYSAQWNKATYCSRCGESLHGQAVERLPPPPAIKEVYTPQRIPPDRAPESWKDKVHAGCQFAKDNPLPTAVAASGAGAAGLVLGPMVIAAGQAGLWIGGITMVTGVLFDSESGENRTLKAGAALAAGSLAVTGAGYLTTAAGGISLATGAGLGAVEAAKGVGHVVNKYKQTEALKNSGGGYPVITTERKGTQ